MLRRRWLQFRLPTVLVTFVLLGFALSWVGMRVRTALRQRAIRAIENVGSIVALDQDTVLILLQSEKVRDDHLASVKYVPQKVHLSLGRGVSGNQLKHLQDSRNLVSLGVPHDTTDDDLSGIACLASLESLHLANTQVTDAGLQHLVELHQLRSLNLLFTNCTEGGVAYLRTSLPNCHVVCEEYYSTRRMVRR